MMTSSLFRNCVLSQSAHSIMHGTLHGSSVAANSPCEPSMGRGANSGFKSRGPVR